MTLRAYLYNNYWGRIPERRSISLGAEYQALDVQGGSAAPPVRHKQDQTQGRSTSINPIWADSR